LFGGGGGGDACVTAWGGEQQAEEEGLEHTVWTGPGDGVHPAKIRAKKNF
jgi:hypothetical protein